MKPGDPSRGDEQESREFMRKQPRQSRSRSLVDAIVEAVDQMVQLVDENIGALSVQSVAERAGVSIGSLYDYFADRDSLLGALLSRMNRDNFMRFEAKLRTLEGDPLDRQVAAMVDEVVDAYLAKPRRTRAAIMVVGRLHYMPVMLQERDRFTRVMAGAVTQAAPGSDPDRVFAVCLVLNDAIMGVLIAALWRPADDAQHERLRRELTELSLAWLRASLALQETC